MNGDFFCFNINEDGSIACDALIVKALKMYRNRIEFFNE